jgi:hypothetical protein
MLTSPDLAPEGIPAVAAHLFGELRPFGLLIGLRLGGVDENAVKSYVDERGAFIATLLALLEPGAELGLTPGHRAPYCYNGASWRDEVPIAGYTGEGPNPGLVDLVRSYVSNWYMAAHGSMSLRLSRAALFECRERGLRSAVQYLLDLQWHGLAPEWQGVAEVVRLLLAGRTEAGSEAGMLARCLGRRAPASTREWMELDPRTGWVPDRLPSSTPLPEDVRQVLSDLVSRGLREAHALRAAASWDEWVLGQAALKGLLRTVIDVYQKVVPEPPLGVRAILSQFDEICADAWPAVALHYDVYPYRSAFVMTEAAAILLSQTLPDWEERLYRERLLVPDALRGHLLGGEASPLPLPWQALSWRLVGPFRHAFERKDSTLQRARPVEPGTLLDRSAALREFFRAHEVDDTQGRELAIRYAAGLLRVRETVEMSLAHTRPRVASDELSRLCAEAVRAVATEEVIDRLRNALEEWYLEREPDEVRAFIREWEALAVDYPWCPWLHLEIGIAYDTVGEPERALASIVRAAVLGPTEEMHWQSLTATLRAMGASFDADVARGVRFYLEDRKNEQADG